MQQRVIDYLRHPLSSKQALGLAIRYWQESRSLPILLITPAGQARDVASSIRVTFSKEKSKMRDLMGKGVYYGFTLSDPFPYTEDGVTGEAIVLRWRMTPLQNLRNMDLLRGIKEEFRDGAV